MAESTFDVFVLGATPGGIMAAVAAARLGRTVALIERTAHIGGLPANGLGATDIGTRGATGGLFLEFVNRVRAHYVGKHGENSPQVRDCSGGYHFEASVAEGVFEAMLKEQPKVSVLRLRQFDADKANVTLKDNAPVGVKVVNIDTQHEERYAAKVFVDATYEGDLAAACGAKFRTRREGRDEYKEIGAGKIYKRWGGPVCEGSTYEGDDVIQAYNYRVCLTDRPDNRLAVEKPATYDRAEFASLVDDVKLDRRTGGVGGEMDYKGIGRIVNMVRLPNGKTDSNNQHLAFLSTDLPEENYPWPTADWAWRDKFARRLRDYTLGLIWFAQNDPELPEAFRQACQRWGLAKDEYADNGNFPRQAYVREGRRIEGEHLFTANDAQPPNPGGRPPVFADSVTASHYALDSHAVRKREPGRCHLDGFLSFPTAPYTVPYGVIVPKAIEQLLTPVPVSGTHIGFSTLRMEPCWMALGQAAGTAAALAVEQEVTVRKLDRGQLQRALLKQKAILIYYRDLKADHPQYEAIQYLGLRGAAPGWTLGADGPVSEADAKALAEKVGVAAAPWRDGMTRVQYFEALYAAVVKAAGGK